MLRPAVLCLLFFLRTPMSASDRGLEAGDFVPSRRARPQAAAVASKAPPPPARSLPSGWTQYVDAESGDPYYHCSATGETQWVRPSSSRHPSSLPPLPQPPGSWATALSALPSADVEALGALFFGHRLSAAKATDEVRRDTNVRYPGDRQTISSPLALSMLTPPRTTGDPTKDRAAALAKLDRLGALLLPSAVPSAAFGIANQGHGHGHDHVPDQDQDHVYGLTTTTLLPTTTTEPPRTGARAPSPAPAQSFEEYLYGELRAPSYAFSGIFNPELRHDYPLLFNAVTRKVFEATVDAVASLLVDALGADALLVEFSSLSALPGAERQVGGLSRISSKLSSVHASLFHVQYFTLTLHHRLHYRVH